MILSEILSGAGSRRRGLVYGAAAGTALSLGGLLVRLMETETSGWQMLTWRSISFGLLMFTLAFLSAGSFSKVWDNIKAAGLLGIGVSLAMGLGQIAYLMALVHTSVANVAFLLGSAPLFVALTAWLLLEETLNFKGILALGAAMVGIAIMFMNGISGSDLLGVSYAASALFAYIVLVLLLRKAGSIDTFASAGLGGVISAVVAIFIAGGDVLIIPKDIGLSVISGVFQVGAGFAFITLATKLIKAAEVTLLVLLETILGPLIVWVIVSEIPGTNTLVGGTIVVVAVAVYSLITMDSSRRSSVLKRS